MTAQSEIGAAMLAASDDGYNLIVGSRPGHLIEFDSYADHPRQLIVLNSGVKSTAAGRYQFIISTWDGLRKDLGLPDFSPLSQDVACVELLRQCGALDKINAGIIPDAIRAASHIWASFPSAGYGQHENKMTQLLGWFSDALGANGSANA
jgi:muramidase (phage lysozyme)